jgi:KamA family protein
VKAVANRTTGGDRRFRAYGRRHLDAIRRRCALPRDTFLSLKIATSVLPFRVNDYVLDELIDWSHIPDDPIFQLTFPQAEMLPRDDRCRLGDLVSKGAAADELGAATRGIQLRMNPHPAGQMELNVPEVDGLAVSGCQHKYRETVLFFPPAGQTCHAFCTYCFRWPQFAGIDHLKFSNDEVDLLVGYLRDHTEVNNVLITGGDPMVMSAAVLRRTVEPLLQDDLEHITSIRIGTKALSYWPYRFTTDRDADDVLRLFEDVRRSGRQLALMAHFSHPREIQTTAARDALRRVRGAGAVVRCQAPVVRHVNDSPEIWVELWNEVVRLGAVPYYFFIARDTGPRAYFEIPLADALEIFTEAFVQVSGLGRTVRGPVMSATPGKVLLVGDAEVEGRHAFVLKLIQARQPAWVNRVFFARYDRRAVWFDDLEPFASTRGFFLETPQRPTRWAPSGPHVGRTGRSCWRPACRETRLDDRNWRTRRERSLNIPSSRDDIRRA